MDIEHPAAKMTVEIAKTQDNEVGDGTTTAIVIAEGYRLAAEKALVMLDGFASPQFISGEKNHDQVS